MVGEFWRTPKLGGNLGTPLTIPTAATTGPACSLPSWPAAASAADR